MAMADDGAFQAMDHIVLGLADHGLEETAVRVGGRTLLNDPEWMTPLQAVIANPTTRFTVSLDGMSGETAFSRVMNAVQRGVTPAPGGYTNWELGQLYQARRLDEVNFIQNGRFIENPLK